MESCFLQMWHMKHFKWNTLSLAFLTRSLGEMPSRHPPHLGPYNLQKLFLFNYGYLLNKTFCFVLCGYCCSSVNLTKLKAINLNLGGLAFHRMNQSFQQGPETSRPTTKYIWHSGARWTIFLIFSFAKINKKRFTKKKFPVKVVLDYRK